MFERQTYTTGDGSEIIVDQDMFGQYDVICWTAEGECHWHLKFDKLSDAMSEFERWR